MVGFGCDNVELGEKNAPFMLELANGTNLELRVIVAPSALGEAGAVDPRDWPQGARKKIKRGEALKRTITRLREVHPSTNGAWEIIAHDYVLFTVRNESYTSWDSYELRKGRWLIEFERSRLLDDLPHHTFADERYPGPLRHFGIYCQDHLVDIITVKPPVVRRLT